MKKIIAIAAALIMAATAFAQDGRSIYQKYSDYDGVSGVFISPAMFRMMGRLPDMEIDDSEVNLSSIIKSLSGMYIINSENPELIPSLKKDADKLITKGGYELMMEAKDNGETVRIFTAGTEEIVTSFVLLTYERDGCTFICLDGQMPREQLEGAIAKAQR